MTRKEFGEYGEIIDPDEAARKLATMLDISIEEARVLNDEAAYFHDLAEAMFRQFEQSA